MEVGLYSSSLLSPGMVIVPGRLPWKGRARLRFGAAMAEVSMAGGYLEDQLVCAWDVWERLAVPFEGLRVQLREVGPGDWELGPAVAVLYRGAERWPETDMNQRAELYYGHLEGRPGLYAFAFEDAIDWEKGIMHGYVVDNRPPTGGVRTTPASFPVPAVVRLTWSTLGKTITRLREMTGNRTFNWLRTMNKWTFHRLISEVPGLSEYLPETRRLRGEVDLAAMVARHGTVFVKYVHGIQGARAMRVRHTGKGLELAYMQQGKPMTANLQTLNDVLALIREVVGPGACVVQQGIETTGREGRALHFRIVTVRDPSGAWRVLHGKASVPQDPRVVFTNLANGARIEDWQKSLEQHYGMEQEEAEACCAQMSRICLEAAAVLAKRYDPLGILGFDIVLDAATRRMWMLEANPVPGWHYPNEIVTQMARSQTDYALALSGY